MKALKQIVGAVIIALVAYQWFTQGSNNSTPAPQTEVGFEIQDNRALERAIANRQSDVQVSGRGQVIKLLRDDLKGSRHQKFILRIPSGKTLLIAHNIDLAPRINSLREGDTISFYGEYEWEAKGGVVHWTHHDPNKRHIDGWLKHKGKLYQ